MALRYMLDTMISSELIRSKRHDDKLLSLPASEISISSISEAEIRYGLAKKPAAVSLHRTAEAFLRTVEIQPFDSQAAASYAELRSRYEREGLSVGNLDCLIALMPVRRTQR